MESGQSSPSTAERAAAENSPPATDYLAWLQAPVPKAVPTSPKNPVPMRLWQPDDIAGKCNNCEKPFCAERLKHHCKFCGRIYCSECTPYRQRVSGVSNQRVCAPCNDRILDRNGQAGNTAASARPTSSSPAVMLDPQDLRKSMEAGVDHRRAAVEEPVVMNMMSTITGSNNIASDSNQTTVFLAPRRDPFSARPRDVIPSSSSASTSHSNNNNNNSNNNNHSIRTSDSSKLIYLTTIQQHNSSDNNNNNSTAHPLTTTTSVAQAFATTTAPSLSPKGVTAGGTNTTTTNNNKATTREDDSTVAPRHQVVAGESKCCVIS